jgi:hypothetical protein
MSGPVAIGWVEQTRGGHGWLDVELNDLTEFCCPGCQDAWLAAHPGALDPVPVGPGRRGVGQPGQPVGETDDDLWCGACGALIQLGLQEPPCPAGACPPIVINRLPSATGERCGACGRWRQLPARLLDPPGDPW